MREACLSHNFYFHPHYLSHLRFFLAASRKKDVASYLTLNMIVGHMRELVLSLAEKAGKSVRLEAPKQSDVASWRGAFLTSTSRMIQPVKEIRYVFACAISESGLIRSQ